MIGDRDEDTWWEGHVKDSVLFLLILLDFFKMFVEVNERVILVILAGDIRAKLAKALELLFHVLGRHLNIGLHAAQVLGVVHLRTSISYNFDILGEEFVPVLLIVVRDRFVESIVVVGIVRSGIRTRPNKAGNCGGIS